MMLLERVWRERFRVRDSRVGGFGSSSSKLAAAESILLEPSGGKRGSRGRAMLTGVVVESSGGYVEAAELWGRNRRWSRGEDPSRD